MPNTWTTRCGSNACGEVTETEYGFRITSTLPDSSGAVELTPDETVEFIDGIRAGDFDGLYARAKQRATNARAAAIIA